MDDGQLKQADYELGSRATEAGELLGQQALLIGIIQALVERPTLPERDRAIKRLEAHVRTTAHRFLVERSTRDWLDAERARAAAEEIHCVMVDALGDEHTEWYPADWLGAPQPD